ncbi:MAG TPA: ribosomal protein S18-alanine N-acetyltransferase [Fibrobacteria bacterium]|nr:ribosomal protein S18-alanine N-acetyltransferase [Fibrobacteria bacterium]
MIGSARPLESRDIPAVAAIEARANPMPWQAADFLPFARPTGVGSGVGGPAGSASVGARRMAWVYEAEAGGEVLGFACVAAVVDEAELQSIAVAEAVRGRGIGSALMETLLDWCREEGLRALHLEVRAGNRPALALYRGHGFAQTGLRRAYYADNGEDALLLAREVGHPGGAPRLGGNGAFLPPNF